MQDVHWERISGAEIFAPLPPLADGAVLADTPHLLRLNSATSDHLRVRELGESIEIYNGSDIATISRAQARVLHDWLGAYLKTERRGAE